MPYLWEAVVTCEECGAVVHIHGTREHTYWEYVGVRVPDVCQAIPCEVHSC